MKHMSITAATLATLLHGCAVVGPLTTIELVKATGAVASAAIAQAPGPAAADLVHHGDAPIASVCIEYNPHAQLSDLVPALHAALRDVGVSSRTFEPGAGADQCRYWLRYAASIQWGVPPFSGEYRAYLSAATFGLHRADGSLMASATYDVDRGPGLAKWSSTRRKVDPVVKALITGFTS